MANTQKRYVCAFCARAFTRSEHKQRHERSHTNEKPFHCLHCTSAFVRRDLLQRHCRTVHNIQLKSSSIISDKVVTSEELTHIPNPSSDLILLLSITKKLDTMLAEYEQNSEKYSISIIDAFLVGYSSLVGDKSYGIFKIILKDLIQFLSSSMCDTTMLDFKFCLAFAIISIGYANNDKYDGCIKYFNKSWAILTMKLIPNYNNNYNLSDQIEILSNLFTLAYICFRYDLEKIILESFDSKIVFNYLNDTSYIIMANLTNYSSPLIQGNLELFWSIYILLSKYLMNSAPPKIYEFLLNEKVNKMTLKSTMELYTKSRHSPQTEFEKDINVLTLSNELNHLIHYNELLIFDSKNSLHNSIILINKSTNQVKSDVEIFELFKKKLLINSPTKHQDLLNNYIFAPREIVNWNLLIVTMKEFNYPFNSHQFISNNLKSTADKIESDLTQFFNQFKINNNVIIVSFPLIFNLNFLKISDDNIKILDFSKFSNQDLSNINSFIFEWYLTMIKVLIKLFSEKDYSYVFQILVYLIVGENFEEFKLNDKWFWILKFKIDLCFESWLYFINYETPSLKAFRTNLSNALMNLISSSLNYSIQLPLQQGRSNSITLSLLPSSLPAPQTTAKDIREPYISKIAPSNSYTSYSGIQTANNNFKVPAQQFEYYSNNANLMLPPIVSKPFINIKDNPLDDLMNNSIHNI